MAAPSPHTSTLAVCIRCAGLLLVGHAITHAPSYGFMFDGHPVSALQAVSMFSPLAMYVLAGALLVWQPRPIANAIAGRIDPPPSPHLLLTGLYLLAVYWLVTGLGDLAWTLSKIYQERFYQDANIDLFTLPSFPDLAAAVVQLTIAAMLLRKPHWFARALVGKRTTPDRSA